MSRPEKKSIYFAVFSLFIFIIRAWTNLNLLSFSDETENFVAAQMIRQGMKLYRDIVVNHSPFMYMVAHSYVTFVSSTDFTQIRWFIVCLALVSAISIYLSPVWDNKQNRLWSFGLYLTTMSLCWGLGNTIFGIHMFLYQAVSGYLYVIPVTQIFIPFFFNKAPTKLGMIASGISIVFICFAAYAYGLSLFFLFLSILILILNQGKESRSNSKKYAMNFLIGVGFSFVVMLLWLLAFADLKGFFVYGFYFNQSVYSKFIAQPTDFWGILVRLKHIFTFSFKSYHTAAHSFFLLSLTFPIYIFMNHKFQGRFRSQIVSCTVSLLLFLLSILLTNYRASSVTELHGYTMMILLISLISISCGLHFQFKKCSPKLKYLPVRAMPLSILLIFSYSVYQLFFGTYRIEGPVLKDKTVLMKPSEQAEYKIIRAYTKPEKDFLALIFHPKMYIFANRLPASGHYYYLPFEAAYNKQPIHSYKIDICRDIKMNKPSIIYFDNWKVWNKYEIRTYEPCVPYLIDKYYTRMETRLPLFLLSKRIKQ